VTHVEQVRRMGSLGSATPGIAPPHRLISAGGGQLKFGIDRRSAATSLGDRRERPTDSGGSVGHVGRAS